MLSRLACLLALLPVSAAAQSPCPAVNFLAARTVNLKPSLTSHIDVVRQSDGSYTGFEVTDAAPYRMIQTTPHFERQFAACLPHTIPAFPSLVPPPANPIGVGSQVQVAAAAGANYFTAHLSNDQLTIYFDVFDPQHVLLSEKAFTSVVSPPGYAGSANERFESLAMADLNEDGKLDLIAVLETPLAEDIAYGGVWTFLGNGDGTFQTGNRQVLTSVPLTYAAYSAAIADLNGDGKPDLVLTGPSSPYPPVSIFLGNGDGTFNPQALPVTGLGGAGSVAIADLNGDGKPDLVIGSGNIAIALGNGDGTFQAPVSYAARFPVISAAVPLALVAIGDVNGDGIPDIVTAGGTILFGDGKGGVASRADYASNAVESVMLADFDGDGKTDIIFGNGNPAYLPGNTTYPSLTVMFGAGGGAFIGTPVSGTTAPSSNYQAIAAADFNGDGIPDVALVTLLLPTTLQLTTLPGMENGRFSTGATQGFPQSPGFLVLSATAADFNHDGKQDLAVLHLAYPSGGEVEIFPGKGDGTFGAPLTVTVSDQTANFIAAPDLNGDGIPDLVITSETAVYVSLGKGDGTFSSPVLTLTATSPSVAFGDFNGDGKLDMAVANAGAMTAGVLLGKGDGTFSSAILSALPAPAVGSPQDIAAADFDGNGLLDLAVSLGAPGNGTHEIAVLSGKGDGSFPASHLSAGGMTQFTSADFNGDGIPDLAGLGNSSALSVRLGAGDGTFQPDDIILSPAGPIAIADLNRDGSPDIVVRVAGGFAAFLNLSQSPPPLTVVSAATFAAGPLAPNAVASAFGEGILRSGQMASGSSPLTTMLLGVTVTVKDSTGVSRLAPLYFVSPNQINFLVPAATAPGLANISINGAISGQPLTAQTQVAAVAPALFTVGSGIAAAYAVQVAPGGAQTTATVFTEQSGSVAAAPINLNQPGQVYLALFGTGFDSASASSTLVTVQGVTVPVTYSGPQGGYAGLDQIDVLLPQSLAGTGVASIVASIGGVTSNEVLVTIQ